MSASLSSSPSQAGPSGSNPEHETQGERQPTVTTTLTPPTGLPAEATSNSCVVPTPSQPLATVHSFTKAETQTRPQSDVPPNLRLVAEEALFPRPLHGYTTAPTRTVYTRTITLRCLHVQQLISIWYVLHVPARCSACS
jgi:hypothetical protein